MCGGLSHDRSEVHVSKRIGSNYMKTAKKTAGPSSVPYAITVGVVLCMLANASCVSEKRPQQFACRVIVRPAGSYQPAVDALRSRAFKKRVASDVPFENVWFTCHDFPKVKSCFELVIDSATREDAKVTVEAVMRNLRSFLSDGTEVEVVIVEPLGRYPFTSVQE